MAETPSKTFYDNSEIKKAVQKARARGTAKKEENQMKRLLTMLLSAALLISAFAG
ncbi:hypothetical protein [Hominenteromicrobium sp.]|uniref:hypothetical protein n=1 Tax=Hominenteromicrobium sp. TaxID=3073581 RepID=UPI003AF1284B